MNKEEADARVAKAHDLRDQLDKCDNIIDHNRICDEYYKATGMPMFFSIAQYDVLYAKATLEEHEKARRLYPG